MIFYTDLMLKQRVTENIIQIKKLETFLVSTAVHFKDNHIR